MQRHLQIKGTSGLCGACRPKPRTAQRQSSRRAERPANRGPSGRASHGVRNLDPMAGYGGAGRGGRPIGNSPCAATSPVNDGQMLPSVGTVRAVLPPTPDFIVPPWLSFLHSTGAIAVGQPVQPPRRTLLGLPSAQLGAAAVVVGAVATLALYRRDHPLDAVSAADVGCSVSAFYTGAYRDTTLSAADPGAVRVADHTTMTTYADTVRRLPAEFPTDRSPRRLRYNCQTLAAWQDVSVGVDSARLHARCAATPVLVIGSRRRFSADLATLGGI